MKRRLYLLVITKTIVFNISESSDALRGAFCHPNWLHTLPSDRMLADATAQWLAARNWRDVIVLVGSQPQDQALRDVWMGSVKRYGLKVKAERKFVLSGDPRQREAGNPKLLTAEPAHAGRIEWPAALHFYFTGVPVADAAARYVANHADEVAK